MSGKKNYKCRVATAAARPVRHPSTPSGCLAGPRFGADPDELIIDPDFDELVLDDLHRQAVRGRVHIAGPLK